MISSTENEFRSHISYYLAIRFFFIFAVLFSFFFFPIISEGEGLYSWGTNKFFLILTFVLFAVNVVSLLFVRSVRESLLVPFACCQFLLEITYWVIISFANGGISSPYLYVIIINIIYSGILMREKGVVITTLYASVLLALQYFVVKFSFLPYFSESVLKSYDVPWESYFSRLFTYMLFFTFTGVVSARITKNLHSANEELIAKTQQSKEMERHFLAIFSNISMGFLIFENGERKYSNSYAEQFEPLLDQFIRDVENSGPGSGKWEERKIGDKVFSYTVMPYTTNQQAIIFSDVTEIRREEENVELNDRLASIGKLTASIAHEIKNPLTSLIGASDLMCAEIKATQPDSTEVDELITIIRREGTRVKTLLDSLFRYTEETKYTITMCAPCNVLHEVIDAFRLGHPDIKIECVGEDESEILGDSEKLREVYWNILTNSAEAMSDTGEITIVSERRGNSLLMTFDDTGPGFSERSIARVFDPFYSTKKRGTGLGLALVYRIVTKHGGSVKAMNTGRGARIVVEFLIKEKA